MPYATISHDGRHAGRGGHGAVLGSKNIKALAVRGRTEVPLADPDRVLGAGGRPPGAFVRAGDREVPRAGHGGQSAGVQPPQHASHPQLPGGQLRGRRRAVGRAGVAASRPHAHPAARPARSAASTSIRPATAAARGWSTRTLFALGPLCGVVRSAGGVHRQRPLRRAGDRHDLGGGTIAFAMECAERGLLRRAAGSGSAAARRCCGRSTRSAARGDRPAAGRWAARRTAEQDRRRLDRLRAAGQGAGDAGLRAARAADDGARVSRSAPAAPITTARARTRPTSPTASTASTAAPPRWRPPSRRRTTPR